jgi:mRNA interferase RelE/StbE
MADCSISFVRSARKELEHLSGDVAERILAQIEAFVENPRPVGVIKLRGQKNLWRMRVGD